MKTGHDTGLDYRWHYPVLWFQTQCGHHRRTTRHLASRHTSDPHYRLQTHTNSLKVRRAYWPVCPYYLIIEYCNSLLCGLTKEIYCYSCQSFQMCYHLTVILNARIWCNHYGVLIWCPTWCILWHICSDSRCTCLSWHFNTEHLMVV